jgi:hypothetical protein
MENETNIEELRKKFAHIKGWAIDADPEDEPNYPYKHYTGDDHKRLNWERPPQQEKTVEVLQSTEHLRTPAVFGTVSPPAGLSGVLRRQAFKYSENMLRHWLMLIFADRVDVVEELMKDVLKGKIPNIKKERGFDALTEHSKSLLLRRAAFRGAIYGAIGGLIIASLMGGNDNKTNTVKRHSGKKHAAM